MFIFTCFYTEECTCVPNSCMLRNAHTFLMHLLFSIKNDMVTYSPCRNGFPRVSKMDKSI